MKLASFCSRLVCHSLWSTPMRYVGFVAPRAGLQRQLGHTACRQTSTERHRYPSKWRKTYEDENTKDLMRKIKNALDSGNVKVVSFTSAALPKSDEALSFLFAVTNTVVDKLAEMTTEERHNKVDHSVSLFCEIGLRTKGKNADKEKLQLLADRVVERLPQMCESDSEPEACRKSVWILYSLSCLRGVDASSGIEFFKERQRQYIGQLPAEELSRLGMALSRLRAMTTNNQLCEELANAAADVVKEFSLKSLIALLTSFSFASVEVPRRLLDAIGTHLEGRLLQLNNKSLAQLCEALSVYSHDYLAPSIQAEFRKRIVDADLRDIAPVLHYLSTSGLLDSDFLSELSARLENMQSTPHPRTVGSIAQSLVTAPSGPVRDEVIVKLLHHIRSDARDKDCFAILDSLEQLGNVRDSVPPSALDWLFSRLFSRADDLNPRKLCRLAWIVLSFKGQSADRFLKDPKEVNVVFKPASAHSIASLCSAVCLLRLKNLRLLKAALSEVIRQHKELLQEHPDVVVCVVHTLAVLKETYLLHGLVVHFGSFLKQPETVAFGDFIKLVWSLVAEKLLTEQVRISLVGKLLSECYDMIQSLSLVEMLNLQELNWWFAERTDTPLNNEIAEKLTSHLQDTTRVRYVNSDVDRGLVELQDALKPGTCRIKVCLTGGPVIHAAVLMDKDFLPCCWEEARLDPTELDQRISQRRGFVCVAVFILGQNCYLHSSGSQPRLSGSYSVMIQMFKSAGWTTFMINGDKWLAKADKAEDLEQWRLAKLLRDPFGEMGDDHTIDDDELDTSSAGYGDDSVTTSAYTGKGKSRPVNKLKSRFKSSGHFKEKRTT